MGASTTGEDRAYGPMRMLRVNPVRRSARRRGGDFARASDAPLSRRQARVDLETDSITPRVLERDLRVDALSSAEQRALRHGARDIALRWHVARRNAIAVTILHGDAQERQRKGLVCRILKA